MKSINNYINEGNKKVISIELNFDDEVYNLLNALYSEYHNLDKTYKRQYEQMYDKICKSAKKVGIELDPMYDKNLSKVVIE